MKALDALIEEYRPVPGAHITSFVAGIASVAEWIAGYAEQAWPDMMDSMMVEVGEYRPDKKADPAEVPPTMDSDLKIAVLEGEMELHHDELGSSRNTRNSTTGNTSATPAKTRKSADSESLER